LASHHLNDHRPLAELAAEAVIFLRCAYKWLARYRTGGALAWWIDAVFAARSGGHSIRSTSSAPWSYATRGSTCAKSPGCQHHLSLQPPGLPSVV